MDAVRSDQIKRRFPRWALDAADTLTRGAALATSRHRPYPDFLIVGAKRGGTTSLFNYLTQHPGIFGLFPQVRGKKSTDYYFAHQTRSDRWYRSHFHTEQFRAVHARRLGYRPLSFEASPYYIWDPRIAPRVAENAPHTRAILLVRDPVKRAWSHYQERVQNGVEPMSFGDALAAEDIRLEGELERMMNDPSYHSTAWDWYSYRSRGEYVAQIERWEQHFPAEQLLVLLSEELYSDTETTLQRIHAFLGVPEHVLPTTRTYNATWRTREDAPEELSRQLATHFTSHNEALAQRLGRELPWRSSSAG